MSTHNDDSQFRMIDVGGKAVTARRAVARGEIQVAPAVFARLQEKTLPKGDALALSEVAGILGAKQTANVLPLCHPLPLSSVRVWCELLPENRVRVRCEARTNGQTGVEMEALMGAMSALLCLYDLTKGLDAAAVISEVFLERKEGGKSGIWTHPMNENAALVSTQDAPWNGLRASVITISDRCSRGATDDVSGQIARDILQGNGATSINSETVPDDVETIRRAVENAASQSDVVFCTGGTGLSPRDVTPEALASMWTKKLDGFGEAFRGESQKKVATAWLSRCEAGLVGNALVFLLPGSPNAVRDALNFLRETLPHALSMARGGGH